MLYESFTHDPVEMTWVRSVRLKLSQVYEYERGKGSANGETTQQIEIIRKMFERHLAARNNGRWSDEDKRNKTENISEAFDIAIATERLKNTNQ